MIYGTPYNFRAACEDDRSVDVWKETKVSEKSVKYVSKDVPLLPFRC
jgi:hypothetical protein